MAAPNSEELVVLKKFREQIKDLNLDKSDLYLLKWLRARDLNIPLAEQLLRNHLVWREKENIDDILNWIPPPEYPSKYTFVYTGRDREGRPICVYPFGSWDVRSAIKSGDNHNILRRLDQVFGHLELECQKSSEDNGREINQGCFIVDMANYSLKQLSTVSSVNTLLDMVRRFEANYPETLYHIDFINAFRAFQVFFSIIKAFLSMRTLGKIQMYTTRDKWEPVILSKYPRDQIPIQYGGTLKINVTTATTSPNEIDDDEYVKVEIPAGKKLEVEYEIKIPKSIIKWRFKIDAHDIGFFIMLNKTEFVLPNERYASANTEETGSYTCNKTGDYTIVFDNTYSKLRGKNIQYVIDIIEP